MAAKSNKFDKLFNQKSTGPNGGFVTDVTGTLVKLESPADTNRKDTYEWEGEVRTTTWRATVQTTDGKTVFWNWPAHIDDDGDNVPGINIIAEGVSINDLYGIVARYYRDPKSRRSTITPVQPKTASYDEDAAH